LGMSDDSLVLWDWSNNSILLTLSTYHAAGYYMNVLFLSSGLLASPASATVTNIWNITSGIVTMTLSSGNYALEEMSNGLLAATGADKCLSVFSLTSGALLTQQCYSKGFNSLRRTNINNYLAGGSQDSNIYIYNINTLAVVFTLLGHNQPVILLDVVGSSGLLVSASLDNSLGLWNMATGANLAFYNKPLGNNIMYALKAISSSQVAVGGAKNVLQFFSIATGNILSLGATVNLLNSNANIEDFRVTSDNVLVVGQSDNTVSFMNLTTNTFFKTLTPVSSINPIYCDLIGMQNKKHFHRS
jgi:WD40 repeat protein